MKNKVIITLSGLLLCAPLLVLAGETGTALKADSVRAEPFADAKTTGNINKGDSLEIVAKKGAWLQIKTKKSTGWVRLLSVKRSQSTNSGGIGGVAEVASGRAGTGKVVSTTGIRGLSAEELKAAKFSEDEIKKMESYQTSASTAASFASAGGLNANKIDYLKGAQ